MSFCSLPPSQSHEDPMVCCCFNQLVFICTTVKVSSTPVRMSSAPLSWCHLCHRHDDNCTIVMMSSVPPSWWQLDHCHDVICATVMVSSASLSWCHLCHRHGVICANVMVSSVPPSWCHLNQSWCHLCHRQCHLHLLSYMYYRFPTCNPFQVIIFQYIPCHIYAL